MIGYTADDAKVHTCIYRVLGRLSLSLSLSEIILFLLQLYEKKSHTMTN